jgi:adenylate kinase
MMGLAETKIPLKNFPSGFIMPDEYQISFTSEADHPTAQFSEPGPVFLLGPPGVGKGTQADTLSKLWGIPKISTGEILRTNVSIGTQLGASANEIMKRGDLVPDHVITEMIANRLDLSDTATGFILDGFPRTVQQGQWLDRFLGTHQSGTLLTVVYMYMDTHKIVKRIVHRTVCPVCNAIYNSKSMPPKRDGRCDKDNSVLKIRADDSVEVIQKRLDVFKEETEPLIQLYEGRPLFIAVDADRPASLVTRDIIAAITGYSGLISP